MAVTLVSCYFFPFLLFFLSQLALPKSSATFVLGIAGVTLSTLILYFQLKNQPVIIKREQVVVPAQDAGLKIAQVTQSPVLDFFKRVVPAKPSQMLPDLKARLQEQERLIARLQEENAKKEAHLAQLQMHAEETSQALAEKEAQIQSQSQELTNLKFEMYTLLRIDSYMDPKSSSDSNKLVSASF